MAGQSRQRMAQITSLIGGRENGAVAAIVICHGRLPSNYMRKQELFIPIYPNAPNCLPKPSRACRIWSILINGLGARRGAITRRENRLTEGAIGVIFLHRHSPHTGLKP